ANAATDVEHAHARPGAHLAVAACAHLAGLRQAFDHLQKLDEVPGIAGMVRLREFSDLRHTLSCAIAGSSAIRAIVLRRSSRHQVSSGSVIGLTSSIVRLGLSGTI